MGYGAEGDEGLGPNIERVQSSFTLPPGLDEHVFENNRRYHRWKDGRYLLPNDEREQEREDMAHAMVNIICDKKLHFAPVRDPQRILDVGTGTGIWVINSKCRPLPFLARDHLRFVDSPHHQLHAHVL